MKQKLKLKFASVISNFSFCLGILISGAGCSSVETIASTPESEPTAPVRVPASSPPAQEHLEIYSSPGAAHVVRRIAFGISSGGEVQDSNCATLDSDGFHQELEQIEYPKPGSVVTLKNTSDTTLVLYLFGHVQFNRRNGQHLKERYFFPRIANDVKVPLEDASGKYSGKIIELLPTSSATFVFPEINSDPKAETFIRVSCKSLDAFSSFQSFGYGTMIEWNTSVGSPLQAPAVAPVTSMPTVAPTVSPAVAPVGPAPVNASPNVPSNSQPAPIVLPVSNPPSKP